MSEVKRTAYIMRGIPGVGKSTIAKVLAGAGGAVHSTNDFFYADGVYEYDHEMLRTYHEQNFDAFCESLDNSVGVVVCDNTNSKLWEYEKYWEAAEDAGYVVHVVYLQHDDLKETVARSPHNPPLDRMQIMEDRWEY